MNIAYTANFGGKDKVNTPNVKNVNFVYFTDFDLNLDNINVIKCNISKFSDTRSAAKWYKMNPHILFPEADYTIWMDSNYRLMRDPENLLTDDIVLYQHASKRKCLFEEADICLRKNVDDPAIIKRQIDFYKKQNMPENFGLFQGNVLIRSNNTKDFNELWYKETQTFSQRDQISLPYVIWNNNVKVKILPHEEKRSYFFKQGKHLFHGAKFI